MPIPLPAGDLQDINVARWHLRRALEDLEEPFQTASEVLDGDLALDAVAGYFQPWETAARILENTEYEVTDGLASKREEKIKALRRTQVRMNIRFGVPVEPGSSLDPYGTGSRYGGVQRTTTVGFKVR